MLVIIFYDFIKEKIFKNNFKATENKMPHKFSPEIAHQKMGAFKYSCGRT